MFLMAFFGKLDIYGCLNPFITYHAIPQIWLKVDSLDLYESNNYKEDFLFLPFLLLLVFRIIVKQVINKW